MRDENAQAGRNAAGGQQAVHVPMPRRALEWTMRKWSTAGTAVAVMLALLLGWHVVNGKNGLSVWMEKRAEDRQLRKQIDDLNQENARLRDRVERLKSDPDAIGMVAHDQLHYTKPNEVIVKLPPEPHTQPPPAASGK
ncbi:MAG: septum formation initiator family protein [Terracidiphilus sp.]|jgi:cell division protein FtsB